DEGGQEDGSGRISAERLWRPLSIQLGAILYRQRDERCPSVYLSVYRKGGGWFCRYVCKSWRAAGNYLFGRRRSARRCLGKITQDPGIDEKQIDEIGS